MTHIETKYLTEMLESLDKLSDNRRITEGEYMQIGLLLKILEIQNDIKLHLQAYTQRDRN